MFPWCSPCLPGPACAAPPAQGSLTLGSLHRAEAQLHLQHLQRHPELHRAVPRTPEGLQTPDQVSTTGLLPGLQAVCACWGGMGCGRGLHSSSLSALGLCSRTQLCSGSCKNRSQGHLQVEECRAEPTWACWSPTDSWIMILSLQLLSCVKPQRRHREPKGIRCFPVKQFLL